MNIELWHAYQKANSLGVKADVKKYVAAFIQSCDDPEKTREWVYAELSTLPANHPRMHQQVFEAVVYPVLANGMAQNDPWAFFWMGQLSQNFFSNKKLYAASNYEGSTQYLERAYELRPAENKFRLGLLRDMLRWFEYIEHEWPTGLLIAKHNVPQLLLDIAKARALDKEGNRGKSLDRLEYRVSQNKNWSA